MPGQPMLHKLAADIESLGGDEHVLERLVDGEPVGRIAESFGVSRALLYKWRDRDPERKAAWEQAIKDSADARVERASEILDELDGQRLDPATVALARARSEDRKWVASKLNREKYGDAANASLTINVASLHLDALRQVGSVSRLTEVQVPQLPSGDD